MSLRLGLLLCLLFPALGAAEIYKWVDESGQIHFGDKPEDKESAERVNIEINSYKMVTYDDIDFYQKSEIDKQVVMYATSWCGYCKKARNYFKKNSISYVEYDIEKDSHAKRRYDALGGKGVPVILVGQKRMNGFSVDGFERIYN